MEMIREMEPVRWRADFERKVKGALEAFCKGVVFEDEDGEEEPIIPILIPKKRKGAATPKGKGATPKGKAPTPKGKAATPKATPKGVEKKKSGRPAKNKIIVS